MLVCVLSAIHAAVMWYVGDPHWWMNVALTILALALRPFFAPHRSFPVFLTAMLLLFAATLLASVTLSLRYGTGAGFHLLLFAFGPLIITSGRIGPSTKWMLVAALTGAVIALDRIGSSPAAAGSVVAFSPRDPGLVAIFRTTNLVAQGLLMPVLVNHYFQLVTQQQGSLLALATRDPLTGLFNRRHAHDVGATLLANLARGNLALSIVLVDLDHFKAINDELGHDGGDMALKHAAALLADEARASDVVCRWGGEEFLVLLPHTGLDPALAFSERFRERLSRTPLKTARRLVALTATIGVAVASDADTLDSAVDRADKALYEGKRDGRNRVVSAGALPAA